MQTLVLSNDRKGTGVKCGHRHTCGDGGNSALGHSTRIRKFHPKTRSRQRTSYRRTQYARVYKRARQESGIASGA